ncbi:MAG: efflux RND transporter permease subunit [Sandaracinus sp.]
MKLGELALRHRAAILLATFALVLGGAWSARQLAGGVYPEIDFPRIVVVAHAGDLPADVAVQALARPLEETLATVLGVVRVRSRTVRGASEVSLTFAAGTDMEAALQHVESAVGRARASLPPGTETEVERLTPTAFPVVTFNLSGPVDPRTLRELADLAVRPALSRVPGVGLVRVHGGEVREVEVVLDPLASASLGLGPADLAAQLRTATALGAAGRLERDHARLPLLVSGDVPDLEALRHVPIEVGSASPLALGAIAEVHAGTTDATSRVGGDRGETVVVSVSRAPGAGTPTVVRAVEAAARALELPPGVQLDVVYDQADLVEDSLASVREAILIGIALCLVVLGLSLRDLRAGAIAAATVPIVLGMTLLVMQAAGATLNLMSLGGMAIAVGLVIDDAIIVLEAIVRRLERGEPPAQAAAGGVSDIGPAVVGTTLTTVVVLLPLAFVDGLVGEFFTALAIPLAAAVLLSLVVSLTSLPIAAARFLVAHGAPPSEPRLEVLYRRVAGWGARRRWAGPLLLGLAVGVGALAIARTPSGFLPALDEGSFVLDYFMPPGTSLEETDRVARRLEAILRESAEVERYTRRTGIELGPAAATAENGGDVMVRLTPRDRRTRSSEAVQEEIRLRIEAELPELRIEIIAVLEDVLNDLADAPHPVEIKVFGDDEAEIERVARSLGERLAEIEGLADLFDGIEGAGPVRIAHVDAVQAARVHLTTQDVLDRVSAGLLGAPAGTMPFHDRRLGVRVRYPDALRFDGAAVLDMPLVVGASAHGPAATIPLRAVASFEDVSVPVELRREALRPVVLVTADTEGRDLGSIAADVRAAVAEVAPPPGGHVDVGGQMAAQSASFAQLLAVLGFGLLATLVVLVAQFRRARPALVVLLTTPFALAGAAVALFLTGTALDVSAMMGMVLLVGLEVKAGILLLEVAEEQAAAGASYVSALETACARRIRPIMMTATATLAGVLPLALETGAGAEIQRPLAIAVLGGIGLSKFLTLVAMPSLAAIGRGDDRGAR